MPLHSPRVLIPRFDTRRALWLCAALGALAASTSGQAAGPKKTLGFAIISWYSAIYETKGGKEECPDGFTPGNDEIWLNSLSASERSRVTQNGTLETTDITLRRAGAERGPNKEDVCWNPTAVKDPPLRTVRGSVSFGVNLDGTKDGSATAKTCAHQKFTSPTGDEAVDNQWYRVIGCTSGWRSTDGYMEVNPNGELRDGARATLIELQDVDDLQNDDNVQITFYQAVDPLVKDASGGGTVLPHSSYRVAEGYRYSTRGRIAKGVLTSDAIDIKFPFFGNTVYAERFIRDMRIRLQLDADGKISGLVAGYYDLNSWWDYIARVGYSATIGHFSCPALYEAAQRLADGYPDPKTGQCTAMSSAFKIEAIPAFIVQPEMKRATGASKQASSVESSRR